MRVGFTGTRNGMTPDQIFSFCKIISELPTFTAFHHGDCVGSDTEAADAVHEIRQQCDMDAKFIIVCHPPLDEKLRAFNKRHDEIRPPLTHFARNRNIVDSTDLLIATPPCEPLPSSGGTVMTVNYAKKKGKPVYIIWPDGTVEGPPT